MRGNAASALRTAAVAVLVAATATLAKAQEMLVRVRVSRCASVLASLACAMVAVLAVSAPPASAAHAGYGGPIAALLTGATPRFANPGPVTVTILGDNLSEGAKWPVLLLTQRIQGPRLKISIPASAGLQRLAERNHNVVNLVVLLRSGPQVSIAFAPVHLTRSLDSVSQARLPNFPKPWIHPAHVHKPGGCLPYGFTYDNNHGTRIGELHVAKPSTMEGVYVYNTTTDSTVSVGISADNTHWSTDGTVSIQDSISQGGSEPQTGGYIGYVDDHMNYEHYIYCGHYFAQATWSQGDAYAGTNTPPGNPYGSCETAEANGWGFGTVPHGDAYQAGTWRADNQAITTLKFMTQIWNFNFTEVISAK